MSAFIYIYSQYSIKKKDQWNPNFGSGGCDPAWSTSEVPQSETPAPAPSYFFDLGHQQAGNGRHYPCTICCLQVNLKCLGKCTSLLFAGEFKVLAAVQHLCA